MEGETLGRYAGGFGDRLFKHLTKVYDLAHAEAQRIYDQRLRESVREEADKLLRAAEQVRLMEYEVGLKLYERGEEGRQARRPRSRRSPSPRRRSASSSTVSTGTTSSAATG